MKNFSRFFLMLTLGIFLIQNSSIHAMVSGDLQDVKVLGHFYAVDITNASTNTSIKDPASLRLIIVKLAAVAPNDGKLFSNDFTLRYFHANGNEDRTQCEAIATADNAEIGEQNFFGIGANGSNITVSKGPVYIALAFAIEKDVTEIELMRHGTAAPLKYAVGDTRPYTAYIVTNIESPYFTSLTDIKSLLQNGNFQIITSTELSQDIRGVSVKYKKGLADEANKMAAVLSYKLGVTPKVQQSDLATAFDLVVWLAKP